MFKTFIFLEYGFISDLQYDTYRKFQPSIYVNLTLVNIINYA